MADPVSPAGNPTPFLPEDIFGAFGPCPETDAERMRRITSQVCMKDRALCLEAARKQAASLENLVRGQNPSHFSFPYPVEGIFYATDHFPPSLTAVAEAAKAVFPIVRQSEKKEVTHLGTMVSVSADGEFATVPHVLYDISDHISTRVGDRNYYL